MDNDVVLFETVGPIATITINRPEVLNAINYAVLDGIDAALDRIESDAEIKVVIIRGAGDRAFIAGADIGVLATFDAFSSKAYCERGQAVTNRIEGLDRPVIAAINGFALGGGCEVAMVCDIRIATHKSKFALPEVTLGVIPGFGGTQRLPRLVGTGIAKQMIFTGKTIDAARAHQIGLVNEVVAEEELDATVMTMAEMIARNSAVAISFAKATVNAGVEMELHRAIAHEAVQFAVNFTSPDSAEGIAAFLEKRRPAFTGLGAAN